MSDSLKVAITDIQYLKHQIDSLKYSSKVEDIRYKAIDQHEIISKVNEYYDSSWNKLILLLGILAILVPLIIQWMQQRNFKRTSEAILNQLKERFDTQIATLSNENSKELQQLNINFNEKSRELEYLNNYSSSTVKGLIFFMRAMSDRDNKDYKRSLYHLLHSTTFYHRVKDFEEMDFSIKQLYIGLSFITSKKDFDSANYRFKKQHNMNIQEYYNTIKNEEYYVDKQDFFEEVDREFNRIANMEEL